MKLQSWKVLSSAIFAVGALGVSSTFGNSITTPTGLTTASEFYVVFVTNTTTDATNPDLSYYDNIAQTDADNNGLGTYNSQPLTWRTIGSSSGDGIAAVDRLPNSNIPVFLPDGTQIADSVSDLWSGGASNPVNELADGNVADTDTIVWTGTGSDGSPAKTFDFNGLTIDDLSLGGTSGSAVWGNPNSTGTDWIADNIADRTQEHSLYAFAGVNVPATVPLPSSGAMGGVGLALLGVYMAGRKLLKPRIQ